MSGWGCSIKRPRLDQLADRLAPLVVARGLGSFMDYYYLLKYSADADEWGRVMDALAVQETYFWREIDQIRAVVDRSRSEADGRRFAAARSGSGARRAQPAKNR